LNTGLLKHGFQVTASWQVKKMFKVSTLSFCVGIAADRLLGTYSFHHIWQGLFITISYKMSFQGCCKMCICRLGFIYGFVRDVAVPYFLLAVWEFWNNMFPEQWIGRRWTSSVACSFP
jgi:hypothetical protein